MSNEGQIVLLIDDDAFVRELYAVKFKKAGFTVLEAESGEAGLKKALSSKPDIILLDILMPGMNGYQVLQQLRGEGEWGKSVPVIVLSNDALNESEEFAAIEATAPAYFLTKAKAMPEDVVLKASELLEHPRT